MKRVAMILSLMLIGWCCADSFLHDKPTTRRPKQQIKNDIIQRMSVLVEQSSEWLEREAQVQQKLCKEIRAFVEGSGGSVLNKSTVQDLERLVHELKKEQQRRTEQLAAQDRFLAQLR